MPGAFLHDERVRDTVALTALTPTAAGMPAANLRDPQPRLRARFTGGAASILVDFGAVTPVEAVALISTNLSATATARWRLGTLEVPNAVHDSGTLSAQTGDEANGNVVLLRSGAATARYLLVDVADTSLATIDIGILAAGPLWPCDAEHQALIDAFPYAANAEERQRIRDALQISAYRMIPYVPYGQWFLPAAHSPRISGVLAMPGIIIPWNIQKSAR